MTTEWFLVSNPPPPNLTAYIHKIDHQYVAGGGFGDVYKCRYLRDGLGPQEVRERFTIHPWACPVFISPSGGGKGVAVQVRVTRRYKRYIRQGIHLLSIGKLVLNGSQASRRELGIWKRLCHDNIVPFLGVAYGFGMNGAVSLVSQWMPNGTLHEFLATHDDKLDAPHRLQIVCSHYSCLPLSL